MQKVFFHSKMTNLKDKEDQQAYYHLEYVEFLDFLCRAAIDLWKKSGKGEAPVHEMVYFLLQKMWDYRATHPAKLPRHNHPDQKKKSGYDKKQEVKEFPELVPAMDLDEED